MAADTAGANLEAIIGLNLGKETQTAECSTVWQANNPVGNDPNKILKAVFKKIFCTA
jgi:hypothetical protein